MINDSIIYYIEVSFCCYKQIETKMWIEKNYIKEKRHKHFITYNFFSYWDLVQNENGFLVNIHNLIHKNEI